MERALNEIREGSSIRRVAKRFSVRRSILFDIFHGRHSLSPSMGRKAVFSGEEEQKLAGHIKQLAKLYYGISLREVKKCAYEYAKKNNISTPFSDIKKDAGKDWAQGFMKRNNR